jgi:Mg-chelatase subunit ChlD
MARTSARPTFNSLDPVAVPGTFDSRNRRAAAKRRGWGHTNTFVPPATFNAPDMVSPTAVASLRKAFTLAKTSHDNWRSFKREGRLDPRQGPRADRGAQDIFKRRTGQSTTRVKCAVLIDASGSMQGGWGNARIEIPGQPGVTMEVTRATAAAVFGATIGKALGSVPTVDLDIFQHAANGNGMTIKWRWSRGTPLAAFNESVHGIGPSGNADGHALFAIAAKMKREMKRGERAVILVVSDGLPSVTSPDSSNTTAEALVDAVAFARKHGITVLEVAIDGGDHSAYYGDGTIPFKDGNWTALGNTLAKHLGKALASR